MQPSRIKLPYVRLRIDKEGSSASVGKLDIVEAVLREHSSGRLPAGSRLPPVRVLHHQFGLSKNTAHAAYEELVERGVVENRKRRGYFMLAAPRTRDKVAIRPAGDLLLQAAPTATVTNNKSNAARAPIPLGSVYIDKDLLPLARLAECGRAALKGPGLQYLHDLQGFGPLREWIARRLDKRGIPAHPDDVIITTGSQQAIDLAVRVLKKRRLATENPAYGLAKQLFEAQQLEIVGLPLDPFAGIDLDEWRRRLAAHRPAALYVTSNFQNPTGYSYSTAELMALLGLSQELKFGLIEDDWGSDMLSYSEFRPPLRALGGDRVLYINTFTKKLLPSLRIGYLLCNARIRSVLLGIKRAAALGNPILTETVLFEFLSRGYYDTHLRTLQAELDARYHACLEALRTSMPPGVRWTTPGGGPILWLEIPRDVDLETLAARMGKRNVALNLSTRDWFFGKPHLHGVRIGYAQCAPELLATGLEILAGEIRRARKKKGGAA